MVTGASEHELAILKRMLANGNWNPENPVHVEFRRFCEGEISKEEYIGEIDD